MVNLPLAVIQPGPLTRISILWNQTRALWPKMKSLFYVTVRNTFLEPTPSTIELERHTQHHQCSPEHRFDYHRLQAGYLGNLEASHHSIPAGRPEQKEQ